MGVEEELIRERAHRPYAEEHDETQAREGGYSCCLFVRADDLEAVLEVVPDPERAVDDDDDTLLNFGALLRLEDDADTVLYSRSRSQTSSASASAAALIRTASASAFAARSVASA